MDLLNGTIRAYPWGSRTLLPALCGRRVPSERPEAELWYGAHPASPSELAGSGTLLDAAVAADPRATLGGRVADPHDGQLPFLVKILAADQPLSLQAHPSPEQAEAGFARENAAGVPVDAPNRNYRDAHHKPEIMIALTEFRAMAGFRPVEATRELFAELDCPECDRYLTMLDPGPDGETDLRGLFTTWITIPGETRRELIDAIVARARVRGRRDDWIGDVLRTVVELNQRYPGDVGVLGALLLNHVTLRPGEAIYLDAGQLHAYVQGMGVEIQANSDNVLRGGLTSKYVDVPELVRVLDFTPLADPRVVPVPSEEGPAGSVDYPVPVSDFVITVGHPPADGWRIDQDAPAILLCTNGHLEVADKKLSAGDALWLAAEDPEVTVTGPGQLVWVRC